jgi:hypothetical protein
MVKRGAKEFRLPPRADLVKILNAMIDLWDGDSPKSLVVPSDRHPANLPLIYSNTAQTVNLSRAVLTLYAGGLEWEALPLIRASLECAVTAAWLSVTRDETAAILHDGAVQRRKLLNDISLSGLVDTTDAAAENERQLDELSGEETQAGRALRERALQLQGGQSLYTTYRALSSYCHPGTGLADEYLVRALPTDSNPYGLLLRDRPEVTRERNWLGIQGCMLAIALIACDNSLMKRRRSTQLKKFAARVGLVGTIARAER